MKVGIIGLGLIGGSLGLDLKKAGLEVLGVARNNNTCQRAIERGVVDRASIDLALLSETDLVFICTPIAAIAPTLKQLTPFLSTDTIVTDVGSVKAPIVTECSQLWHNFVGGHPMAGTAEQGIEAAQFDLFVDAPYVITGDEKTPPVAIAMVEKIANLLGSKVEHCSPEEHDRAVAWISHLPVQISANLIYSCTSESDQTVLKLAQKLASSGFRDTSRVGGGNPELGVMMAEYNTEALLRSLHQYRQHLDKLISSIEHKDWQELKSILQSTQRDRPKFIGIS
jgi:arogenate dehydrogenase (NADP+)